MRVICDSDKKFRENQGLEATFYYITHTAFSSVYICEKPASLAYQDRKQLQQAIYNVTNVRSKRTKMRGWKFYFRLENCPKKIRTRAD